MITTVLGPGAIAISTAAPANASRLSSIPPCCPPATPPRNAHFPAQATYRVRVNTPPHNPYKGAPSPPPEPDDGEGAGDDGPGDPGDGDGLGVVGTGDRSGTRIDGVGSGGGGGGSFTTG
ncbi:hypothetical protein ACFQY7_10330 [Actinomadura luteofluorescens]|uniref:hypothetical protein n=1 Tax=Actinomadura luteofluorescens TaxID=46163 RepID=UPI00363117BE